MSSFIHANYCMYTLNLWYPVHLSGKSDLQTPDTTLRTSIYQKQPPSVFFISNIVHCIFIHDANCDHIPRSSIVPFISLVNLIYRPLTQYYEHQYIRSSHRLSFLFPISSIVFLSMIQTVIINYFLFSGSVVLQERQYLQPCIPCHLWFFESFTWKMDRRSNEVG